MWKIRDAVNLKELKKYNYLYNKSRRYYYRLPNSINDVEKRIYVNSRIIEAVWREDPNFRTYNVSGMTGVDCLEQAGLVEKVDE